MPCRPRGLMPLCLIVLLAACASGHGGGPGESTETVRLRSPTDDLNLDLRREGYSSADTVLTSPPRVWHTMPRAVADRYALNVRITTSMQKVSDTRVVVRTTVVTSARPADNGGV